MKNVSGGRNRLFAVALDSADETILVQAADWPYTFFKPFTLGEANWPEKYLTSSYGWSKDGSLAVWYAQERDSDEVLFMAAYDYNKHKGIDLEKFHWDRMACNRTIFELLSSRGGRNSIPIEIPGPNSGLYQK